MEMEVVVVPFRTDPDGTEVLTYAFTPVDPPMEGTPMSVAIIGIGMHPFGRFDGVTGLDLGAFAIRQALADAGLELGRHAVRVRRESGGLAPGSEESSQADAS